MALLQASCLLLLLLALACSPASAPQHPASGGRTNPAPSETASASRLNGTPSAVWVLSPIGLNLRRAPDPTAERATTLPRGLQLDALEAQTVRGERWLKVRTHDTDASEGWVLDQPELLIATPVETHYDPAGYSLLYPAQWTATGSGPSTAVLQAPGGAEGLTIEYEDDPAKLAKVPTSPGRPVREEGPLEVYGKTVFITVYKLNAAGYQFEVRFKSGDTRAYLFLGNSATNDTKLYRQLLASVIISA